MKNIEYKECIPSSFTRGDSVDFDLTLTNVDQIDYSICFAFSSSSNVYKKDAVYNLSNKRFELILNSSDTKNLTDDVYNLVAVISRISDISFRKSISIKQIKINKDLSKNVSEKSYFEGLLEAVRCQIMGLVSDSIQAYTFNGRSVTKMSLKELITAETYALMQIRRENVENGVKNKNGGGTVLLNYKKF